MASTVDLVNQSNGDFSDEKKKTFKDLTIKEKLAYLKEVISVEPILATYLLAVAICIPALKTLELEKACRSNLEQNGIDCTAIRKSDRDNYTELNEEITILSNIHSWLVPCQNIAPLILVFFFGSYSDRHQIRKPFMILPLLGELLAVIGCIISVIFMEELPVEIHVFLQRVLPSLFGGSTMLIMAIFSYVADTSSVEMRTFRVAVVQIVLNVTLVIGQFLSGLLFIHLDYIGVLLIGGCLYLFGLAYGIFCINEKKSLNVSGEKNLCSGIFDPTNAIDTIRFLAKREQMKNKFFLWRILIMFFIVTGVSNVDTLRLYYYLQTVFKWTSPDFFYYATTNTFIHLVGLILFVPLFTKIFALSDVTILILTLLDKIITTIIMGLAKSTLVLYIASFVSIISNISIIVLRSMATKVVSQEDLGKALSLFGICEAVGKPVSTRYFDNIFVKTLKSFPSAFLYCESLAYGFCLLSSLIFYCESNKGNDTKVVNPTVDDNNQAKKPEEIQITHI